MLTNAPCALSGVSAAQVGASATKLPNALADVYLRLGQPDKARAQAEEVLKINPKFSLESMKILTAFKDPVLKERRLAELRKAGLK